MICTTQAPPACISILADRKRWVHWKLNGTRKVPVNINGSRINCHDSENWLDHASVCKAFNPNKHSGIGFVFAKGDGLTGIDLDGCRNPETGELDDWAEEIVIDFNSYTEVSPSGTGVKIYCIGVRLSGDEFLLKVSIGEPKKKGGKAPGIEVYSERQFFTFTGKALDSVSTEVEPRQLKIEALCERYLRRPERPKNPQPSALPEPVDGERKIKCARAYVAKMPEAIQGSNGSGSTFSVACFLVRDLNLTPEQAMPVMLEYNDRCQPPWEQRDLEKKLRDADKFDGPRGTKLLLEPRREDADRSPTDSQPATHSHSDERSKPISHAATSDPAVGERPARRLKCYPLSEWCAGEEAETSWVVDGIAGKHLITLLVAGPRVGKTTLISHILEKTKDGGFVANYEVMPCRVLMASEEPKNIWEDRRGKVSLGDNVCVIDPKTLNGSLCRPTMEEWIENVDMIAAEAVGGGYDLVIIDTFQSFGPAVNENDSSMGDAMRVLKRISSKGIAVIVVHHASKVTKDSHVGQASRGHNSFIGASEICVELGRYKTNSASDPRRKVSILSKLISRDDVIELVDGGYVEWHPKQSGKDKPGDSVATTGDDKMEQAITSILLKPEAAGKYIKADLAVALGVKPNDRRFMRVFKRMDDAGKIKGSEIVRKGKECRALAIDELATSA